MIIIWRAPRPYGASPTQPYKCSRNVKINVKTNVNLFISAQAKIKTNAVFLYARYGGYRPCGTLTAATKRCTPTGCKIKFKINDNAVLTLTLKY